MLGVSNDTDVVRCGVVIVRIGGAFKLDDDAFVTTLHSLCNREETHHSAVF